MKHVFSLVLLALWCILGTAAARAQPGTVDLKDAANAVVSSHASIGAAYAAIPATLTQAYTIELKTGYTSGSETYPINMTPKAGASAANTITIRPAPGTTGLAITGSTGSNTALLKLDDADWIIVDGRPGGVGTTRGLTIHQTSSTTTAYGAWLINGAANNAFRWCIFNGYSTASTGGKCIYINTSAANPTGNSNNAFEFLQFIGGRTSINSSGTDAANNNNLRVYGCEFLNTRFAGFWGQGGTGHTAIDSNYFYNTAAAGTSGTTGTGCVAILFDFLGDTAIITRNRIHNLDNGSFTTDVYGIAIRSFDPYPSYSRIVNNFIALDAPNAASDVVYGIEYGTNSFNNAHVADVHFNSVYIGGTTAGGTAGALNSAAFSLDASNTASTLNVSNNLFVNARSGGLEDHVAVRYATQNGTISRSNNILNAASGNVARVGTTLYTTVPAYAAAVSSEAGSNATPVQFASATDLHLTGTSVGNPDLAGAAAAGIITDIDGDPRTVPYRGADEAAGFTVTCSGTPAAATIVASTTAPCAGGTFTLTASGQTTGTGIFYYWQSRPAGSSGAWNTIAGATAATLSASLATPAEFRFMDSCGTSALATASNTLVVTPSPLPVVISISEAHALLQYTFGASGALNVTGYSWNFGDGSAMVTGVTPSHAYAAPGTYTVTLMATNACGADTAVLVINAQACSGAPASNAVFRSDSTLCPGETALLHVIFAAGDFVSAPYLAVQWQSSPGGTSWTNVSGATNDSLTVTPTDTTRYRYILTCGGVSGGVTTSNAAALYTLQAANVLGIASVNTGPAYTFTATTPQGVTAYAWDFGDGTPQVNGTMPTQAHAFAGAGPYTVTLRASGPCGADTVTLTITLTNSIEDAAASAGATLYPNPASENISVRSAAAMEEVAVLDMKGAVILKMPVRGMLECTADVRGLAAGAYILRVQTARGVAHLPWRKL